MREILARPPRIIEQSQRVKYGALLGLSEMAESAFSDLKRLAESLANPEADFADDPVVRHRALTLAWSIVDQADLLRELIVSEGQKISMSAANDFLKLAEDVREVRNWLRHIPQRIGNYVSAKKAVPPVMGALSYTVLRRWNGGLSDGFVYDDNVIEYNTIVIVNTCFERDGRFSGAPINYAKFRYPVDHFVLQAFGMSIHLDALVEAISMFCNEFALGVARVVDATLKEWAARGEDIESAKKPLYDNGAGLYRMVARRD